MNTSAISAKPSTMPSMPYMDSVLRDFHRSDDGIEALFKRHIHWGYWPNPGAAESSFADYEVAAERLTRRVCDAANISNGMRILDCGCGVGGTIASLNERFSGLELIGLNVDARQLEVAHCQVKARPGNRVEFLQGDACRLPFADGSFDAVLAVECIFHFPGRLKFLREAQRVLRSGRCLGISDFVPLAAAFPALISANWSIPFFGHRNPVPPTVTSYRALARLTNLKFGHHEDITRNTLPSYEMLERYFSTISAEAAQQTRVLAKISRRGLLRYRILSFEKR